MSHECLAALCKSHKTGVGGGDTMEKGSLDEMKTRNECINYCYYWYQLSIGEINAVYW